MNKSALIKEILNRKLHFFLSDDSNEYWNKQEYTDHIISKTAYIKYWPDYTKKNLHKLHQHNGFYLVCALLFIEQILEQTGNSLHILEFNWYAGTCRPHKILFSSIFSIECRTNEIRFVGTYVIGFVNIKKFFWI